MSDNSTGDTERCHFCSDEATTNGTVLVDGVPIVSDAPLCDGCRSIVAGKEQ